MDNSIQTAAEIAGQQDDYRLLSAIASPSEVRGLLLDELTELAEELRRKIIGTVSATGGHLAPSLGVVELTLALMNVYDFERDRIVWDVGHQAYAYKLLTGRFDRFHTLRQFGGVSGFPRREESRYDHFGVGHSSTSISAALGLAMARDLANEDHAVAAVIGDGSMTAGLAYEGLNQAGDMGRDLMVVLNDNEMSISKNVGALSSFLSRHLSGRWVVRLKKEMESLMRQTPRIGQDLVRFMRTGESSLKGLLTPGMLFEAFRFNYLGPIDGHDLSELVDVFGQVKELKGPVLVHVLTKKGKGYAPAEKNPTYFHGVGCFEPETGAAVKHASCTLPTYTDVFGHTLIELAGSDDRIVAITAAMPEGTGLSAFAEAFPERFVDVGICEQHAVTFAAGLAADGYHPVVAIYSTFLQRSYDQVVHDVCLQNLPVTLCLDRAGLVGEDGATHHGAFDVSYLRHIPNLTLMAPKDEAELRDMLATAVSLRAPTAIRYPRGLGVGAKLEEKPRVLPVGEGEWLRQGADIAIVAVGSRVWPAHEAAKEVEARTGRSVAVYNARFIKPLPERDLLDIAERFERVLLIEESALAGGFGSAVLELWADKGALRGQKIRRIGLPDVFIEHGAPKLLRRKVGVDQGAIRRAILEMLGETLDQDAAPAA